MSIMTQKTALLAKREHETNGAGSSRAAAPSPIALVPRRRGRPPLCAPEQVLDEIRAEAAAGRLVRVHLDHPALYARSRRLWGSWAGALLAAGLDPKAVLEAARRRALETRRRRREGPRT
jgi:hypothetical protein